MIKGLIIGIILGLVIKLAVADSGWFSRDDFAEFKSTEAFEQFR